MAIQRDFEGSTLEEALGQAALKLGVPEPDLHYEILETGKRGIFGLGTRKVRIRVDAPEQLGRSDEPDGVEVGLKEKGKVPSSSLASAADAAGEPPSAAAVEVQDTVQRMFDLMGMAVDVEVAGSKEGVRLQLGGDDRKMLVAKDAELLSAMQFLLNRMSRRAFPEAGRVQLTCDGYRSQRDDELIELAREVAQQVSRTGKAKRLHAMNPYERRLVHMTVRELDGLSTRSEGDGFLKKVRVFRK